MIDHIPLMDPMPGKARPCPLCGGECKEIITDIHQMWVECTQCTWGELYWT